MSRRRRERTLPNGNFFWILLECLVPGIFFAAHMRRFHQPPPTAKPPKHICPIKGCQDDKIYGLTKDGRLHRLSFSKSLLLHISAHLPGYTLARFRIIRGRRLSPNEPSSTGLYGIVSHKDFLLRGALDQRIAEFLCDWKYRYLCELQLQPCSLTSKTEEKYHANANAA
jgi:hypothetical protein